MNLMSNIPNFNSSNLFDQEKLNSIDPLENQLCRVCEEPAAGFHFGAFTCEGCKSFFGRSCNNQTVIQECKNNYRCVVDRKNRTACKACRLRKCLMVGMSKSGCRYGRRSNWFKIHCLMQKNAAKMSTAPYPVQNPRISDAMLGGPPSKLNQSRSPSPLNTSSESLSVQSSPSPALVDRPVSPPTSDFTPPAIFEPAPSMLDQNSLYRLSPLLAVHPLLLAANPLLKLDFGHQLELLKQRRAMFEALRAAEPDEEEAAPPTTTGSSSSSTETPIDLSCK